MLSRRRLSNKNATDVQVLDAMLAGDDGEPVSRDGVLVRLGFVSTWLAAAGLAGGIGYLGMQPEERPPAFTAGGLLDGTAVDCRRAVGLYEPENETHLRIARGTPAIITLPGIENGLLEYSRLERPVVVGACDMYLKQHPGVAEGTLFTVDSTLVPRTDISPDSVQLVATVTEIPRFEGAVE